MLRYSVTDFIHRQVELSLNANEPNDFAPIQVRVMLTLQRDAAGRLPWSL